MFGRKRGQRELNTEFPKILEAVWRYVDASYYDPAPKPKPKPETGRPSGGDLNSPRYSLRPSRDSDTHFSLDDGDITRIIEYGNSATGESVGEKLQRLMLLRNMSKMQLSMLTGISRSTIYRILADRSASVTKDNCILMLMALQASLKEAREVLAAGGYTFSRSSKRDLVFEKLFEMKEYSTAMANLVLDAMGLPLLKDCDE